ncbi:MAG: hypothetical protein U0Y82_14855 [Thermoleophilia bacterium]
MDEATEKAQEALKAVSDVASEATERVTGAVSGGGGLMGFLRRLFGGQ